MVGGDKRSRKPGNCAGLVLAAAALALCLSGCGALKVKGGPLSVGGAVLPDSAGGNVELQYGGETAVGVDVNVNWGVVTNVLMDLINKI